MERLYAILRGEEPLPLAPMQAERVPAICQKAVAEFLLAVGPVTRSNVEALLRGGRLQVAMRNGKWWDIRPNGKLKRYKRDPMRLRLPFKYGLYGFGQITEDQFMPDGMLDNTIFRVKP